MSLISGRLGLSTLKLRLAFLVLLGVGIFAGGGVVAWADEPSLEDQIKDVATGVDFTWTLMAAFLVFFMQAGFAFLGAGLIRSKSTVNYMTKSFLDFCIAALSFWAFGFALMFGVTYGGIFGTSGFFFGEAATPWLLAFFIFQMGFCGTATTIVSGAVAERMRFGGYLVVATILSGLIYPLVGH